MNLLAQASGVPGSVTFLLPAVVRIKESPVSPLRVAVLSGAH
jgi:hypothetical protein